MGFEDITIFVNLWNELAKKEGLKGFYFVGKDSACRIKDKVLSAGLDAVYDDNTFNPHSKLTRAEAAKMIYMAMQSE